MGEGSEELHHVAVATEGDAEVKASFEHTNEVFERCLICHLVAGKVRILGESNGGKV